jgi:hypothetical protein
MRRLPSVNRLVGEIEQLVKTAEAKHNEVTTAPPTYSAPIAAELQKVAQTCRQAAVNVTVGDVEAFARKLMGGAQ